MPQSYRDYLARCPFYTTYEERRLRCSEGPVLNSRVSIAFADKASFNTYRFKYCCDKFEDCRLYQIQCEKYAEKK